MTLIGTERGIKIKEGDVELSDDHVFLHDLLEKRKPRPNLLDKIIDNPMHIFEIGGSMKTNLKLYFSIKTHGKYLPNVRIKRPQKILYGLIKKDLKAWKYLFEKDITTFYRFSQTLGFKAWEHFGLKSSKLDMLELGLENSFVFRVHKNFCIKYEKNAENSFITNFSTEYNKMLMSILNNEEKKVCEIRHSFYSECELYNNFVMKTGKYDYKTLKTLNERGIRDFVINNLE